MSGEEISMEKGKVKVMVDWKLLTNVKGAHSFWGLASFYRHFISDFVRIAQSLTKLMKKDQQFTWKIEQQEAFRELKKRFISALINN